jgi:replicative DNA helicase
MGISAHEVVARARLAIRKERVKLVVVDYLQRLRAPGGDLRQQVAAASEMLCSIPKTEGVPVVAVSALTRPPSRREDEPPNMFWLRESGNIEYDAHTILLINRPKTKKDEHDEVERWSGKDEIVIAKQREGVVGTQKVRLDEDRLRFVERT